MDNNQAVMHRVREGASFSMLKANWLRLQQWLDANVQRAQKDCQFVLYFSHQRHTGAPSGRDCFLTDFRREMGLVRIVTVKQTPNHTIGYR